MSRTVAVIWHASFSLVAAVLYFFFVLPRWPELLGDTSHTLGTALRIVTGALIGLAALPVSFTLVKSRRPEFGTPQLALSLRKWSIVLHVLAAVLIVGAAISEIWLSLDTAGQWLFGIYGAAAAIALLGIFAFHLAYVAELPPPPPKPLKPKSDRQRRRRGKKGDDEASEDDATDGTAVASDTPEGELVDEDGEAKPADDGADDSDGADNSEDSEEDAGGAAQKPAEDKPAEVTAESAESDTPIDSHADEADESPAANGRLRNRRRKRLRGGVAVED